MLVEAVTYRFRGHSMADPEEYRSKEEVAHWRERDPIPAFGALLGARGDPRLPGRTRGDRPSSDRTVDAAVTFAEDSPFPAPESLYEDVYVLNEPGPRRLPLMAELRYREALNAALREELKRDERVLLMGEDIGVFGGAFKVTDGLLEEFGERRVRDTPISENTIVGVGVGAAMSGLRPVVELMTINFALLAFDQIVNSAAHIRYMFGGQVTVPLVIRMPQGAGHQLGPTHSHCLEAMFLHVPGLLVAVPSTPADAKGLLKTAIRDENPVIFIEHESLYGIRGEVPEDDDITVEFGRARVAREGTDVTIVGVSRMALTAERAAATLAQEHGVEAEVIDPRTLRPLDLDTILASVQEDQPLRRRRGGLAARRRRREPGGADRRARLRRPRRTGRARVRRRRADALLKAARGDRLPARAADRARPRSRRSAGTRCHGEHSRGGADGRDRHAEAVGHDGGGHDPAAGSSPTASQCSAARSSSRSRPTRRT